LFLGRPLREAVTFVILSFPSLPPSAGAWERTCWLRSSGTVENLLRPFKSDSTHQASRWDAAFCVALPGNELPVYSLASLTGRGWLQSRTSPQAAGN
jgi:hypothetical protein